MTRFTQRFSLLAAALAITVPMSAAAPAIASISYSYPPGVSGFYSRTTVGFSAVIDAAAPSGGAAVTVASSDPALLMVPATVTVPAGKTSGPGQMKVGIVTRSTPVTISASYGGSTKSQTINLLPAPPAPVIISVSPASGAAGAWIIIKGTDLTTQVKVGNAVNEQLRPVSNKEVWVQLVRSTPPGVYAITVTNPGGVSTSTATFRVTK